MFNTENILICIWKFFTYWYIICCIYWYRRCGRNIISNRKYSSSLCKCILSHCKSCSSIIIWLCKSNWSFICICSGCKCNIIFILNSSIHICVSIYFKCGWWCCCINTYFIIIKNRNSKIIITVSNGKIWSSNRICILSHTPNGSRLIIIFIKSNWSFCSICCGCYVNLLLSICIRINISITVNCHNSIYFKSSCRGCIINT